MSKYNLMIFKNGDVLYNEKGTSIQQLEDMGLGRF
jgi:hypothetical protein